MTFGWDLAIGASVLLVLLLIMTGISALAGSAFTFLRSVIMGQDNRTSTSKTFVFMWTLLIGWVIISLVLAGEVWHQHACAKAAAAAASAVAKTIPHCTEKLGLFQEGWNHFVASGLTGNYMVLLGIPASAAVGAKVITSSKADSNQLPKPRATGDAETSLVSCRVDSLAVAFDGVEDLLGGLGPDVRAGVLVPVVDPVADVGVELADGCGAPRR